MAIDDAVEQARILIALLTVATARGPRDLTRAFVGLRVSLIMAAPDRFSFLRGRRLALGCLREGAP